MAQHYTVTRTIFITATKGLFKEYHQLMLQYQTSVREAYDQIISSSFCGVALKPLFVGRF